MNGDTLYHYFLWPWGSSLKRGVLRCVPSPVPHRLGMVGQGEGMLLEAAPLPIGLKLLFEAATHTLLPTRKLVLPWPILCLQRAPPPPCAHPQADGQHLSWALPCLGCSPSLSPLAVFGRWARLVGRWARLAGHWARLAGHWASVDLFSDNSGGTYFLWDRGGGGVCWK